jgi:DNA-binding transcriptional LysR family regulator
MDRLDAMAIFVAVVDQGSLAAAARALGRSPATVTRAIAVLESRLGERLLHRNARALRLTDSGERHVAVYRAVLAELDEAEQAATGPGRLDGTIGITAPELFGRLKVMPVLEMFLAGHPAVRARLLLLNRVVNLVDEGVDVAVRLAPLPDSGIVATRLGEMRKLTCAAPSYLARCGVPESPAELRRHICIGTEEGSGRELWRFTERSSAHSRSLSVALEPRIALNSAGTAVETAVRGSGICRALSYQVVDHLAAGRLVALLPAFEPDPTPVHLVFHPIPRRNAVLRAFIDHATPRLRAELAAISSRMAALDAASGRRPDP